MTGIFSRDELLGRIHHLQHRLQSAGIEGALILQRVDMIYYTGSVFQGAVAIPAKGVPRIFAWRRLSCFGTFSPAEPEQVKGMGHMLSVLAESDIAKWKTVGLEEDVLPAGIYKSVIEKVLPHANIRDVSPLIRTQRMIKSPAELDIIRRSGKVLASGFEALRDIIKEGEYEYNVQAQMDVVLRRSGDQLAGRTRGFNAEVGGVVASGRSAGVDNAFDGPIGQPGRNPLVPKGAGNRAIQRGEPVMCDHTAGVDGYMTDMTRTYAVGDLPQKFIDAHQFCIWIHEQLLDRARAGAVPAELYLWSLKEADKAGYGENFMNQGPNKVRFIGHGVGLELDEWPVLAKPFTDPLEAGVVLAIEPKIIFDDGGVGVEDTVIVRENGRAEVVTKMQYDIVKCGN